MNEEAGNLLRTSSISCVGPLAILSLESETDCPKDFRETFSSNFMIWWESSNLYRFTVQLSIDPPDAAGSRTMRSPTCAKSRFSFSNRSGTGVARHIRIFSNVMRKQDVLLLTILTKFRSVVELSENASRRSAAVLAINPAVSTSGEFAYCRSSHSFRQRPAASWPRW